jgi:hypothetical protein
MENSTIVAMVSMILTVSGILVGAVNHKRIRSNCCGVRGEVSLDISDTTVSVKGSPALPAPKETP